MTNAPMCRFVAAKGLHLFVFYRVAATGYTGECCFGCGVDRVDAR